MKTFRQTYSSSTSRGFSLLEVMVATAIFALLIAVTAQMVAIATRSASNKVTESNVQVKGERTLKLIVDAVTASSNLGVDDDSDGQGHGITFYTPIDIDNDGTVLDKEDGTLEYGAETTFATGDGKMHFKFVKEVIIRESDEQVDLNGDGDLNDKFDMGYIIRTTKLEGEDEDEELVIGVNNVIQRVKDDESPDYGASILDDSDPDTDTTGQIFSLLAGYNSRLYVSLWLVAISSDRRAHLVQCRGQIFLRNQ